MIENHSVNNSWGKPKYGQGRFDGIRYLWQIPDIRYLLKLIIVLFGSMICLYCFSFGFVLLLGDIVLIEGISTQTLLDLPVLFCEAVFVAGFLYVLIELSVGYFSKKAPQYAPKSQFRRIFSIVLFGILVVLSLLLLLLFYPLLLDIMYIVVSIFFITGLITARGAIRSFNEKYYPQFQEKSYSFFLLVPIPWIILVALFFGSAFFDVSNEIVVIPSGLAVVLYAFLAILGLIVAFKQDWRSRYTTSQVSGSLTFLSVIILPFFIGLVVDLFGALLSLLVLVYLYIQGTLDELGDNLREAQGSEEKSVKAYHNVIIGLFLLVITFFGLIFVVGGQFYWLGATDGMIMVRTFLSITSVFENYGLIVGLFLFIVLTIFRKPKDNN